MALYSYLSIILVELVKFANLIFTASKAISCEKRIEAVLELEGLFKGTVRSNLLWGRGDAADEELMRAARIAQAEDVIAAKGGLDGEIAQEGRNLFRRTASAADHRPRARAPSRSAHP